MYQFNWTVVIIYAYNQDILASSIGTDNYSKLLTSE